MNKILHAAALVAGLAAAVPQSASAATVTTSFEGMAPYPVSCSGLNHFYAGQGVRFSCDNFVEVQDDGLTPPGNHALVFFTKLTITTSFHFTTFSFDFLDTVEFVGGTYSNKFTNDGSKFANSTDIFFGPLGIDSVTFTGTTFLDQLIFTAIPSVQLPEPASLALVALALGGAGFASRRRR